MAEHCKHTAPCWLHAVQALPLPCEHTVHLAFQKCTENALRPTQLRPDPCRLCAPPHVPAPARTRTAAQVIEVGQVGGAFDKETNTSSLYLHAMPPDSGFGDASLLLDTAASVATRETQVRKLCTAMRYKQVL